MTLNKKIAHRLLFTIGYIFVFASYIYSIYYSMPANDDYAWAIEWWSENRVVEIFHRIGWNYMNSFGNSGIFAIAVQVLFHPLYWFKNVGHSFGICMIIVNIIIMTGILWAIRTIFKHLFIITSDLALDTLTFLVALLLTTSYYYSDVYNWWSGTPGYSGMMMVCLIACATMLRYQNDMTTTKYIVMIILGMIACTSMMYCVAVGTFYILTAFILGMNNGDSAKRKAFPLFLYIISGLLMVLAPGNYTRMSNEQSTDATLLDSIIVTAYRIVIRLKECVQTKPWVVALVVLILLIGFFVGSKREQKLWIILWGTICCSVSAFSGVMLYVFGSNKTFDSEFTPRIYYVEDYLLFVGMALIIFAIGAWTRQKVNIDVSDKVAAMCIGVIVIISAAYTLSGERYRELIQVDILAHKSLIRESWFFWDEILDEIEHSEPHADLVIDRDNVDWCKYSYYVGLDDIPREPLGEDARYGNCNQCASKYYGVDSIIVNLY